VRPLSVVSCLLVVAFCLCARQACADAVTAAKVAEAIKRYGLPQSFLVLFSTQPKGHSHPGERYGDADHLWVYPRLNAEVISRSTEPGAWVMPLYAAGAGNEHPSDTTLDPLEFSRRQTPKDIEKRFGRPKDKLAQAIGQHTLVSYVYARAGNAPARFCFLDGQLAGVSAGTYSRWHLPGTILSGLHTSAADLERVLGTWTVYERGNCAPQDGSLRLKYQLSGSIVLERVRGTPGSFAGRWQRTAAGTCSIARGAFDRQTGFVQFNLGDPGSDIDSCAQLVLSPDAKTLTGAYFLKGTGGELLLQR
jgi:hypothetical protein